MAGPNVRLERSRSGWDIALGVLAVVAGVIVLGEVVIASVVSILFLGWMMLIGGVVLAISSLFNWGRPGHWWALFGGLVLAVIGLGFVRNPGASLLTLTLLAGSLLLVGGIVRIIAAFQDGAPRGLYLFSGIVTLLLGLMVMYQWPASSLWFLGTLLGVELIMDGFTLMLAGRVRVVPAVAAT